MPNPDSPHTNSGLYARAGASATATAAACANRFDAPMTNVSKVYFSLSLVCEFGAFVGCGDDGPANVGQISVTVASASPSSSTSSPPSPSSVDMGRCDAAPSVGSSGGIGNGWSTFTARETSRPRWRESAVVMGSRSARSMASFAKSLGAASSAVPSRRPIGRVTRIQARCWAESVPDESSWTTSYQIWPRSVGRSDTYDSPPRRVGDPGPPAFPKVVHRCGLRRADRCTSAARTETASAER